MTNAIKYPKTMHLHFSPGLQNDDRVMPLNRLHGREVVVTEKMDGENTSLYRNNIHARSIDGRYHPSRDWVKRLWGERLWLIPPGTRVCGENMYAQHSIEYKNLPSYFLAFSIWDGNTCLSWDDTLELCDRWDFETVPELWRGEYSDEKMMEIAASLDTELQEGFVVRTVDSFDMEDFHTVVGKWVRENHVQTDEHWMHQEIIPNKLVDSC